MSGWASRAGAGWRVLRAEGLPAAMRRTQDHLQEWRRRREYKDADALADRPSFTAPVLNVLATTPAPWSGGVATQFSARIEAERALRPCAVLYRDGGVYRLEVNDGSWKQALRFPTVTDVEVEGKGLEAAVHQGAAVVRARLVHFEGAGGFPIASLLRLAQANPPVLLSLHDFSLFCRRPHLVESPAERFCDYCEDQERCARCLRQRWTVADGFQDRYRADAGRLLESAAAVVYPSPFLQQAHARLFPRARRQVEKVIPPAAFGTPLSAEPPVASRPPRHVALVGAVHPHKGAFVFDEIARALQHDGVRLSVLGGGDPQALMRLRRNGRVSVRGYYRAGTLAATLRRERVDLALLLSITPESYCLALDECLQAGVPVVAFDHGAVGERLRSTGGGVLVAPSRGATGILEALDPILDGRAPLPVPAAAVKTSTATSVAAAHLELYAELEDPASAAAPRG